MNAIVPGYEYELKTSDDCNIILRFSEFHPEDYNASTKPSTSVEEVLKVVKHRLDASQAFSGSREKALAITKLQECMFWLNQERESLKSNQS